MLGGFLNRMRRGIRRRVRGWLLSLLQEDGGAPLEYQAEAPSVHPTGGPPEHWVNLVKDKAPELLRPPLRTKPAIPARRTGIAQGPRAKPDAPPPTKPQPAKPISMTSREPRGQPAPIVSRKRVESRSPEEHREQRPLIPASPVETPRTAGTTIQHNPPSAGSAARVGRNNPVEAAEPVRDQRATNDRRMSPGAVRPRSAETYITGQRTEHQARSVMVAETRIEEPLRDFEESGHLEPERIVRSDDPWPELNSRPKPPRDQAARFLNDDKRLDRETDFPPREIGTGRPVVFPPQSDSTRRSFELSYPTSVEPRDDHWPELPRDQAAAEPARDVQRVEEEHLKDLELEQSGNGRWSE